MNFYSWIWCVHNLIKQVRERNCISPPIHWRVQTDEREHFVMTLGIKGHHQNYMKSSLQQKGACNLFSTMVKKRRNRIHRRVQFSVLRLSKNRVHISLRVKWVDRRHQNYLNKMESTSLSTILMMMFRVLHLFCTENCLLLVLMFSRNAARKIIVCIFYKSIYYIDVWLKSFSDRKIVVPNSAIFARQFMYVLAGIHLVSHAK